MNKPFLAGLIIALAFSALVWANQSPNGPGQPGAAGVQSGSGSASSQPNGFGMSGFAHAGSVYAGSAGTQSAQNAQSSSAVAQYDVACFEVSQP